MPRNIKETYLKCKINGTYIHQSEINIAKIKSMLNIAKEDIKSVEELKKTNRFNTIYKLSYDILHTLTEALILFDKIKSKNHICLFAYFCTKHNEFDWNFFEKIRTKRNGIHYYGSGVDKNDWDEVNAQIALYIKKLKDSISHKLNQQLP